MGNEAHEFLKLGHEVLFAFEEAIGYMCGCTVLDKDGISAAAVMAEFAGWLENQGKTFRRQMEELYVRLEKPHSLCHLHYCVCVRPSGMVGLSLKCRISSVTLKRPSQTFLTTSEMEGR